MDASAVCNMSQLVTPTEVLWQEWDTFLVDYCKAVKGIRQLRHFVFSSQKPGVVVVNKSIEDPGQDVVILKTSREDMNDVGPPQVLQPAGLTADRVQIRPYIPSVLQDELCPPPQELLNIISKTIHRLQIHIRAG